MGHPPAPATRLYARAKGFQSHEASPEYLLTLRLTFQRFRGEECTRARQIVDGITADHSSHSNQAGRWVYRIDPANVEVPRPASR